MRRHSEDDPEVGVLHTLHFEPLLPWQRQAWQQLLARASNLPHGLLLTGGQGEAADVTSW